MTRGGKRTGAGRPKGSNIWGESTKSLRVPLSRIADVMSLLKDPQIDYSIPLYTDTVRAGLPTAAASDVETYLDLNTHIVKHPATTFCVIASGDSMEGAGIFSGDMLIVEQNAQPAHGKIVVASINGELTVKRLWRSENRVQLLPENPHYPALEINEEHALVICGVVTHIIRQAS